MLPPALIDAADRLITALMTLARAIAPIALAPAAIAGSISTLPAHAAQILALRLASLVATLIRISNFGIRAPAKSATPALSHPAPTARRAQPGPTRSFPRRRPGWLLAALPDVAPAIAADLDALLADPAFTALLAAAPTLHRALRPLLRGLDLAAPTPPSPRTPPPDIPSPAPPPNPSPPSPRSDSRASQAAPPKSTSRDQCRPTSYSLQFRN